MSPSNRLILALICFPFCLWGQVDSFLNQINELELVLQAAEDVNRTKEQAETYIALIQSFAASYPKEVKTPELLFRAGDVSVGLKQYEQAIAIWDQLIQQYPEHALHARSLFFKGFVFDTKLSDIERARTAYRLFLESYPEHELSATASLLLQQLGSTDQDLIEPHKKQN